MNCVIIKAKPHQVNSPNFLKALKNENTTNPVIAQAVCINSEGCSSPSLDSTQGIKRKNDNSNMMRATKKFVLYIDF